MRIEKDFPAPFTRFHPARFKKRRQVPLIKHCPPRSPAIPMTRIPGNFP
jgi:hypothetical protein